MSYESHFNVTCVMFALELESVLIQFSVICCLIDLETYFDYINEDLFNKFPGKSKDIQKASLF